MLIIILILCISAYWFAIRNEPKTPKSSLALSVLLVANALVAIVNLIVNWN